MSPSFSRLSFTAARSLLLQRVGVQTTLGSGVWGESVYRTYSTTIVNKARLCVHDGCSKHASFGSVQRNPIFCKSHKEDGMEDVKNRRCGFDGCRSLNPLFNYPSESKGLFCATHKRCGMQDVRTRLCAYEGCKVQPVHNYPSEKRGLYCLQHKLDGMKDVMSKQCGQEGCNIHVRGKGVQFCCKHRGVTDSTA